IWHGLSRHVEACRSVRRQNLEGSEAGGSPRRATHEVRAGDQPEDGEDAGPHDPALAAAPRRPRDRVKDDPRDATIRRLRSELQRAREDIAALEQRLSYAEKTILDLRAKLPTRINQAAPPR